MQRTDGTLSDVRIHTVLQVQQGQGDGWVAKVVVELGDGQLTTAALKAFRQPPEAAHEVFRALERASTYASRTGVPPFAPAPLWYDHANNQVAYGWIDGCVLKDDLALGFWTGHWAFDVPGALRSAGRTLALFHLAEGLSSGRSAMRIPDVGLHNMVRGPGHDGKVSIIDVPPIRQEAPLGEDIGRLGSRIEAFFENSRHLHEPPLTAKQALALVTDSYVATLAEAGIQIDAAFGLAVHDGRVAQARHRLRLRSNILAAHLKVLKEDIGQIEKAAVAFVRARRESRTESRQPVASRESSERHYGQAL